MAYTSADVIAEHLRWLQMGRGKEFLWAANHRGAACRLGHPPKEEELKDRFVSDVTTLFFWGG